MNNDSIIVKHCELSAVNSRAGAFLHLNLNYSFFLRELRFFRAEWRLRVPFFWEGRDATEGAFMRFFFLLLLVFYYSHFTMRRPCNSHSHDEKKSIYPKDGTEKMGRDTHRCLVGCLEGFKSRNTEGTTTAGAATRFRTNTSYLTAAKASRKHVIWLWRFHTDCVKFFKIHQRRPDRFTYCMQLLF